MPKNWRQILDPFGVLLLEELGFDYLPREGNPVTGALRKGLVERVAHLPGYSIVALSRAATICQMAVFDALGGPERDDKPKALRRHWYSWYKTEFAQPLSLELGEDPNDPNWGTRWAGRLSQTYAGFVDSGEVTYRDLWVEDASRMMKENWARLFGDLHLIVAVEKDSLFGDFEAAACALGARCLYSGKGKSSKAAIEKMLREYFHWQDEWSPFTRRTPLIIIHVSDYDYDGEAVIGPTFAEQCRRYTPYVVEARVGVNPRQLQNAGYSLRDKWYQVKLSNSAYKRWAKNKAVFDTQHGLTLGLPDDAAPDLPAYGFEVEAMRTRDYYRLMVDALLSVLPFNYIVERLRDECTAGAEDAANRRRAAILEANADYRALLAEVERLAAIKEQFELEVFEAIYPVADAHAADWRDEEDDPQPEQFKTYVSDADGAWGDPWRPFSRELRTGLLADWLDDEEIGGEFEDAPLDWR